MLTFLFFSLFFKAKSEVKNKEVVIFKSISFNV